MKRRAATFVLALSACVAAPVSAQALDYRLQARPLAPDVYVVEGANADFSPANGCNIINTGFIVTDAGVLVVNTGPSRLYGEQLRALIARTTRSCMLDVLNQDYIRTARAKGLGESWVVWGHALRNAFIPVLTVIGLQVGLLMGGVVVTETVFSWPGVGRLAIQAIYARDFPVVQAVVLFFALIFVAVNLIVDLLYAVLDPRIGYR